MTVTQDFHNPDNDDDLSREEIMTEENLKSTAVALTFMKRMLESGDRKLILKCGIFTAAIYPKSYAGRKIMVEALDKLIESNHKALSELK